MSILTEDKLPHSEIYTINHETSYLNYWEAIDKRLKQAEAITFMASSVTDESYIFDEGVAVQTFQFLYDTIQEIRFFHEKEFEFWKKETQVNKELN